jgi:hypothetical protein
MAGSQSTDGVCKNIDKSVVTIPPAPDWGDMGKEERVRVVLEFLAEHGLALPPRAIFRNLRFHQNITFSLQSVENYLEELSNDGYVERVNPAALEKRQVEEVPADNSMKAYYVVTEAGRQHLRDEN